MTNIDLHIASCVDFSLAVFPVDSEQNEVKRDWLVHTISPDNPDQGR